MELEKAMNQFSKEKKNSNREMSTQIEQAELREQCKRLQDCNDVSDGWCCLTHMENISMQCISFHVHNVNKQIVYSYSFVPAYNYDRYIENIFQK